MFHFVISTDLAKVLGKEYDHVALNDTISAVKKTGNKQFFQGLTIELRKNKILISTPKGKVYSILDC